MDARLTVYINIEKTNFILDTVQNEVQMATGFSCKFVLISGFCFQ